MARTTLTVQEIGEPVGILPSFSTIASGVGNGKEIEFDPIGTTLLIVKSTGAATTVTILTPDKVHGLDIDETNVVSGAGVTNMFFLVPIQRQADNNVYVDFSNSVNITVAAIRMPK